MIYTNLCVRLPTDNNVSVGSSSASNVTAGVASGNVAGVGGVISQSGVSSGGGVGVAGGSGNAASVVGVNVNNSSNNAGSVGASAAVVAAQTAAGTTAAVLASLTNKNISSSSNSSGSGGSVATTAGSAGGAGAGGAGTGTGGGVGGASGAGGAGSGGGSGSGSGLVPTNIQMVSQYIQTGLPYYQQPVYSYEELQMMQQRVPHVVSSWRKAKANTKNQQIQNATDLKNRINQSIESVTSYQYPSIMFATTFPPQLKSKFHIRIPARRLPLLSQAGASPGPGRDPCSGSWLVDVAAFPPF